MLQPLHLAYYKRGSFPLNNAELMTALVEFRPTLVVPDYLQSVSLMHSVASARMIGNESHDAAVRALHCSLPDMQFWSTSTSKARMVALAEATGLRVPKKRDLHYWLAAGPQIRAMLHRGAMRLPVVAKSE